MSKISFRQALLIAIGSSIGGGIYFKSDDVLMATQGNAFIAIMGWLILGGTFIFAGLGISILANRTRRDGGIIAYVEDAFGEKAGFATGWFFSMFYSPTQIAILAWVTATYGLQIFDLNSDILGVDGFYLVIFGVLTLIFLWNVLSTKFTAMVSAFSTSVKLIPLILIPVLALIGFAPSDPANIMGGADYVANNPEVIEIIKANDLPYDPQANWLKIFIGPLLAMAFTFDGWHTVGALSVDMKNPQRDLARVFTISLTVVTAVYTIYFLGINMLMPSDQIIFLGDAHVDYAVRELFGRMGGEQFGYFSAKAIIVIVTISVLGATNSFTMGTARYVQALAEEGHMFKPKTFRKFSPKFHTPFAAGILMYVITIGAFLCYYAQEAHGWFGGIVIDELPVAFEAMFFIPLMYAVFMLYIKDRKNVGFIKGFLAPIIGALGQIFILLAFFANNSNAVLYFAICILVIVIGLIFKKVWFDKYRATGDFKSNLRTDENA